MQARENSVKQLSELYNVVIGVALSLAIYNTTDTTAQFIPIKIDTIVNFLTFLVLILPLYHGAVRHLFATYVEDGGSSRIKAGALLADFFLLFIEGCLFVMMATAIANTSTLAWIIVTLLVLDSLWGFLAWIAFTGAQSQFSEKKWAVINIITASILVIGVFFSNNLISNNAYKAHFSLFIVIWLRTIIDYMLTWDFYFPPKQP